MADWTHETTREFEVIVTPHVLPLPNEIRLSADRGSVLVGFEGRPSVRLSAGTLRRACRCAGCRREVLDGTRAPPVDGITVERLAAVGGRAVTIAFSDGHDRGVFPLDYLGGLSSTPTEVAA